MKEKEVVEENEEEEEEAVCGRVAVHSHAVKIEASRINEGERGGSRGVQKFWMEELEESEERSTVGLEDLMLLYYGCSVLYCTVLYCTVM